MEKPGYLMAGHPGAVGDVHSVVRRKGLHLGILSFRLICRAADLIENIDLAGTCFAFIPDPTWQTPLGFTDRSLRKSKPLLLFYSLLHEKGINLFYWRSIDASHAEILTPVSSLQLVYWACLASLASRCSSTSALRSAWKSGTSAGLNAPALVYGTAGSVTLLWEGLLESHLSASQSVFTLSLFVLYSPHICLQLAVSLLMATLYVLCTVTNSWSVGCLNSQQ